ncbi:MAG: hypothetical protein ACFBSC_12790 [Microcoleaceae cyanobacterium]
MKYHDQLHPWVVYRLLPNCQNIAIARFRSRSSAEMYLIAVRRLMPNASFCIAFDPPLPNRSESTQDSQPSNPIVQPENANQ